MVQVHFVLINDALLDLVELTVDPRSFMVGLLHNYKEEDLIFKCDIWEVTY